MPTRPTVNFRKTKDLTPQLKAALASMRGSYATVGIHEDAGTYEDKNNGNPRVPQVAYWLENGTNHMPARPFLAPTMAHKERAIQALMMQGLARVSVLKAKPVDVLRKLGFAMQVWVQNAIRSNVPPPLSEGYAAERLEQYPEQGTRTLIASGLLLRSIRYVLFVDGRRIKDHAGAEAAPEQPQDLDKHRRDARRELSRRAGQRAYGAEHPQEVARRFAAQRKVTNHRHR